MSSIFGGLLFFMGLILTGTGIVLLATATATRPWWMWGILIAGVILLIIGIFTWMFFRETTELIDTVEAERGACPLPQEGVPVSGCYRDVEYTYVKRVPCDQPAVAPTIAPTPTQACPLRPQAPPVVPTVAPLRQQAPIRMPSSYSRV